MLTTLRYMYSHTIIDTIAPKVRPDIYQTYAGKFEFIHNRSSLYMNDLIKCKEKRMLLGWPFSECMWSPWLSCLFAGDKMLMLTSSLNNRLLVATLAGKYTLYLACSFIAINIQFLWRGRLKSKIEFLAEICLLCLATWTNIDLCDWKLTLQILSLEIGISTLEIGRKSPLLQRLDKYLA